MTAPRLIDVKTDDGIAPCWVHSPSDDGTYPGVILFPDAGSVRPALHDVRPPRPGGARCTSSPLLTTSLESTMQLPTIQGIIRRRILVNFRADPDVVARLVPSPLRPKLSGDHAVVGICLIRLEQIRPPHVPAAMGISSENAAHRISVAWTDVEGREREGVYIPRRDTSSHMNHLAGGRLFPGEHHLAAFEVADDRHTVALSMQARDGDTNVVLRGSSSSSFSSSLFASLDDASEFFRHGSLGYSARRDGRCLDGITLHTNAWKVSALHVDEVRSSFFEDTARFPEGSVTFDHALLMRDIPHEWHSAPDMTLER